METAAATETETETETETVDRSAEYAFFAESDTVLSDYPMSFDAQPQAEWRDLEGREQRREFYSRIVSGIVAALAVMVVLAFTRPPAHAAEAEPLAAVAAFAPAAEPAAIQSVEPAQLVPAPEPSVGVVAPTPKVASAPSASASSSLAPTVAPRPRRAQAPVAPIAAPPTPDVHADRPPPTARFAD